MMKPARRLVPELMQAKSKLSLSEMAHMLLKIISGPHHMDISGPHHIWTKNKALPPEVMMEFVVTTKSSQ